MTSRADNTRNKTVSGIPLLSRIPFIGPWLFGNVTRSDVTSELFLFLTPHIISSDAQMADNSLRERARMQAGMPPGLRHKPPLTGPGWTAPGSAGEVGTGP